MATVNSRDAMTTFVAIPPRLVDMFNEHVASIRWEIISAPEEDTSAD
jgi:hypothetical protein